MSTDVTFLPGTEVEARGLNWEVVSATPMGEQTLLRLRGTGGAFGGSEVDLLSPFEQVRFQSGRTLTVAAFAFPESRVAVYVDGASIHLGSVLRRDRRIEQRLAEMEPAWRVLRFRRAEVDGAGENLLGQLQAVLPVRRS